MALGALVNTAPIASVFADTKVVDPSGSGDYRTIQAAVNDLPNPGPRTIIVRAGVYNEALSLSAKNTLATNDSRRIIIMADTNTAPGSVIVMPPSGSPGVYLNQSRFIVLQGLMITGVSGKNVPAVELDGDSQDNESIAIIGCLIHHNDSCGIQVGGANPHTWIMNNLIHDNGTSKKTDHGVTIAAGADAMVYMVNNTIVRNAADGVFVNVPRLLYLVNNLIVSNGKNGFECGKGSGKPVAITMLGNMFYANAAVDIAQASKTLDATDSGNRTTTGKEGAGVVGCTFPNCAHTASLTALFVYPDAAAANFHLATGSPAIDCGVNTFMDGSTTWTLVEDLEGNPRPQDGDGDCFAIVDAGCYEAPTVPCQGNAVPALAGLLVGDGRMLISNVNASALGGIPAAGYATIYGSYANMTVGTATFATTAGNALNFGNIPPSGYVQTGDPRVVNAITALYSTGSGGSVTVSGNTGTINFGSGGGGAGGVTNRWLLNGNPALTNDELEIVTAGGLTGALSNYASRVQLTLSNAAPAQSLSNVLAVGNISGTGIVMSANDATTSHGLFFIDGNGLTNQFLGSVSNVVHVVPAGQTNIIWDSGNLSMPTAADGSYTNMSVGTATFAASAATSAFASSAGTSTNALELNGIEAAGYSTTNLMTATSNTLAGAILVITNGLPTTTTLVNASNTLAAATLAITNGLAMSSITNGLPTTAITNGLETITAANALTNTFATTNLLTATSNTLAGATALKLDITSTNNLASTALVTATSNTLAGAILVITNGLPTTTILVNASNTLAAATLVITNGLPTTTTLVNASNTLAGATETARTHAIATNKVANATYADSAGTAGTATSAGTAGFATSSGYATSALTATNCTTCPTSALTNGLETAVAANSLTNGYVVNRAYAGFNRNAFLEVRFGTGLGTQHNLTISDDNPTINWHSLLGYYKYDPGTNYNESADQYTCPVAGIYKVTTKIRICDNEGTGNTYIQGCVRNDDPSDTPTSIWFGIPVGTQRGSLNVRISHFDKGDTLVMIIGPATDPDTHCSDGDMVIELLSAD